MTSFSSPTDIQGSSSSRNKSIFEVGEANSLSKFASSYLRAQKYVGSSFLEDEDQPMISPCTSITDIAEGDEVNALDEDNYSGIGIQGYTGGIRENADDYTVKSQREYRGYENLNSFQFPHDEETTLLSARASRTPSILSNQEIKSTVPQTIFNSVNTLIGIGMLSLPYGMKISGWLVGTSLLLGSAIVTCITANMLGKILRRDHRLTTYGDIAYAYGGKWASIIITCMFSLDILGAMLSLIILFSDSFSILLPVEPNMLKLIIVSIIFFLSFLPLSVLSCVSLMGIICCTTLLGILVSSGIGNPQSPGSLISPEATTIMPPNYNNLILALGIMMAPWGGHPVFPELFKDMRHPHKFSKSTNVSFGITYFLDFSVAVTGYLMYGQLCEDSVSKNMMKSTKTSSLVKNFICFLMGILPILKTPLLARPFVTVYEKVLKLNQSNYIVVKDGKRQEVYSFKRIAARIVFCCILLTLAIIFPSFGKVIAFLGSAICIPICMVFPLAFYLKFFKDEISMLESILLKIGIVLGILGAIIGTYGCIKIDL